MFDLYLEFKNDKFENVVLPAIKGKKLPKEKLRFQDLVFKIPKNVPLKEKIEIMIRMKMKFLERNTR